MAEPTKNEIRLDLRSNPGLLEHFTRKKAGESCTVEITFDKKDISAEGVVTGIMTDIAIDGYEPSEPDSKEAVPSETKPVAVDVYPAPGQE